MSLSRSTLRFCTKYLENATKTHRATTPLIYLDVLALHVRAQNAAIIIRKGEKTTVFEVFEVSPLSTDVVTTKGKLIRSFPGPAIEVPNATVESQEFRDEFASFVVQMDIDILEETVTKTKTKTGYREEKSTADPKYISEVSSLSRLSIFAF